MNNTTTAKYTVRDNSNGLTKTLRLEAVLVLFDSHNSALARKNRALINDLELKKSVHIGDFTITRIK